MEIVADFSQWKRQAKKFTNGLSSISITLLKSGRGEVVTSPRHPIKGDTGRVLHGRAIANILRTKGGDVFALPSERATAIGARLSRGVSHIFDLAMRSGRPQEAHMRRLLRDCVAEYGTAVLDQIGRDAVRANATKYGARKRELAGRAGVYWVNNVFGNQPTWGVKSGRFAEGVKWRVSRSKRALRSVYEIG